LIHVDLWNLLNVNNAMANNASKPALFDRRDAEPKLRTSVVNASYPILTMLINSAYTKYDSLSGKTHAPRCTLRRSAVHVSLSLSATCSKTKPRKFNIKSKPFSVCF